MKLINLFPAFFLMAVPLPAVAQLVDKGHAMAEHGWTAAKDVPALAHKWSEAADLPFPPNQEGFKSYLENRYDFKVISMEGCSGSKASASVSVRTNIWTRAHKEYQCKRVFYETTDPRGTKRCMGKFWFNSLGKAPGALGEMDFESVFHGSESLKNDCRWL